MDLSSAIIHQHQQTSHHSHHNRFSINVSPRTTLITSAVLGLVGVSAYWVHGLVQDYGWEGAFNYIWEGDPYPHIRQYLDALARFQTQLRDETTTVDALQEALERARLNSVDSASDDAILEEWQTHLPAAAAAAAAAAGGDLKKTLGGLSYKLDQLASKIDAVPGASDPMVKARKKSLSNKVVALMEQTDRLIAFFQKASLPQ